MGEARHPDPDRPEYDVAQFNIDRQRRANEFEHEVGRLAVHKMPGMKGLWVAVYDLEDGTKVELLSQRNPRQTHVRWSYPPKESTQGDGVPRRVTIVREYSNDSGARHLFDQEALLMQDLDLPPAPELDRAVVNWFWALRAEQLEPGYKPPELIDTTTTAIVECKLPNSPNFRTERLSPVMPSGTQTAHFAARRAAGEPAGNPPYSPAEHEVLMYELRAIDPAIMKPDVPDDSILELLGLIS